MRKTHLLHEISWVDFKDYVRNNDLALLPTGSTEQHGPHNPLGTDHLVAKALAFEASKKMKIICLPTIPFGISSEHRHFPGTIFIQPDTFKNYVKDVCNSLFSYGIKKVIIVNAHGGNITSLRTLSNELRAEEKSYCVIFQWFEIVFSRLKDLFKKIEMDHAGGMETSLNFALYPNLVKMDKVPHRSSDLVRREPGIFLPWETIYYTMSGVFGSSKDIDQAKGKMIFRVTVDELCKLIRRMQKISWDKLITGKW
jgi:creatinine amidohydrolase